MTSMTSTVTPAAVPAAAPLAPAARPADLHAWVAFISDWLHSHATDIAIALAAGALIYVALRFARRMVRRAARRHPDNDSFGAVLLHTLARTGQFFLIMAAARLVIGYANPPELIAQTIRLLFIIASALQVAIWARELVMGLVRRRVQDGDSSTLGNAVALINILVSVAVFAIATIVILDNLGVNVTGLIAGLGIGGIAIGLAAQGIFSDLFAALSIIFDRPFRIGDTIAYDSTTATVEHIGLKSTRLRSVNGQRLIISNTNLLSKEIGNFARLDKRRVSFAFGVIYQTSSADLNDLPALLAAIVTDAGQHFVRAGMVAFGASSLDFELLFEVESEDIAVVQAARHAIALRIVDTFAARGIAFAYPTQTSFTAAPDGTMILPYATAAAPPATRAAKPRAR